MRLLQLMLFELRTQMRRARGKASRGHGVGQTLFQGVMADYLRQRISEVCSLGCGVQELIVLIFFLEKSGDRSLNLRRVG